jgi:plasmid stabilization system protein ParE
VLPDLVIYRYSESDDTATILRIVHGGRNITRALLGG